MRPPKYYDVLFKKLDPALMEQISDTRRDNFNPTDCTPDRLKVREICAQAQSVGLKLSRRVSEICSIRAGSSFLNKTS
jgi:hypothetical protein